MKHGGGVGVGMLVEVFDTGSHYLAMAGLHFTEICLPLPWSAEIRDVHCRAQHETFLIYYSTERSAA